MFTGLVEEVGKVVSLSGDQGTKRLTVAASKLPREMKKGDSIAVSGVCLTAVEIRKNSIGFDLAVETLARTSLSRLAKGALVNLELPMKAGGRMGGHIVQGHVDGGPIPWPGEDRRQRRLLAADRDSRRTGAIRSVQRIDLH